MHEGKLETDGDPLALRNSSFSLLDNSIHIYGVFSSSSRSFLPPPPSSYWIPSCQQIPLPTFTCFCVSMARTVWSEVLSWVEEGRKGSPSLGSPINGVKHVFIVLSLEFRNLSLCLSVSLPLSLSSMHSCTHPICLFLLMLLILCWLVPQDPTFVLSPIFSQPHVVQFEI